MGADDVAAYGGAGRGAGLALHQLQMAEAFVLLSSYVPDRRVGSELSIDYPKQADAPAVGIVDRLEDEGRDRPRRIDRDVVGLSGYVGGREVTAIERRRQDIDDRVESGGDANAVNGGAQGDGEDFSFGDRRTKTAVHLIARQGAFVEKLLHQVFVALCDRLDELRTPFFDDLD